MNDKKKVKDYKRFYPLLKWVLSIASIYFFVKSLQKIDGNILAEIKLGILNHPYLACLIALLALLNWNAEAQKFKLLIRSEIHLSNLRAFLTILGGMAISNFTPARTGEYIGRGLLLKKVHPIKVVIATVAGNIAQVLMTYGLGVLCIVFLLFIGDYATIWQEFNGVWIVGVLLVAICFLVYYAKSIVAWVKPRLPSQLAKTLNLVKKYDKTLFGKVTAIAFLRYLAFALQFYLLLQLFSDYSLAFASLALIPVAYLMQSVAPVPAISDVGVRVAVSQLLFGSMLTDNAILQAVTCLWFINLIFPGLVGTVYLLISTLRNR